jgi:hypothetical protein
VEFTVGYEESGEEDAKEIAMGFIRPFDLACAPLLRVNLVKIAEKKHIWMFDMHHTLYDGISFEILLKEFTKLYVGEELARLKLQYKDFVEWQVSKPGKKEIARQEDYWQKLYTGELPELELPTDFPRPRVQDFKGDSIILEIHDEEKKRLKRMQTREDATLFMVLLVLYYILLSKLSGKEDIIIGTPAAGRQHADLQHIIGMFVNTLAIRNFPRQEKTFKQFLKEVRKNCLEAFENQEYPFENLVTRLPVKRDISRHPLFDVLFVLQNNEPPEAKAWDLQVEPYAMQTSVSHFDLMFLAHEAPDSLRINIEYATALFKRETIEKIAEYYTEILKQVLDNEDIQLKDIKITYEYAAAESAISTEKEEEWVL